MLSLLHRALRHLAFIVTIALCMLTSISASYAEDEEDGEPVKVEIQYVPLKPAFVTNYKSSKLRYFKTDISVKVRGAATADAIDRHALYIRHNLVMLFSNQDQNSLNSQEGKQKLQEDALNQVVAVLNEENEPSDVEGILFTSFIVE